MFYIIEEVSQLIDPRYYYKELVNDHIYDVTLLMVFGNNCFMICLYWTYDWFLLYYSNNQPIKNYSVCFETGVFAVREKPVMALPHERDLTQKKNTKNVTMRAFTSRFPASSAFKFLFTSGTNCHLIGWTQFTLLLTLFIILYYFCLFHILFSSLILYLIYNFLFITLFII